MNDTKGDSIRAIVEQLRKAHEGKDPNEHVSIRRWELGRLADRLEAASEKARERWAETEAIKIMMRNGIRERNDALAKHKAGLEMNERLHVRVRALQRELDLRRASVAGRAMDWVGRFVAPPLLGRVVMAVLLGREGKDHPFGAMWGKP